MKQTIIAPASAHGRGAIAIIRLSGEKAKTLFKGKFSAYGKISDRKAVFGTLTVGNIKDDIVLLYYKAPNSYTGEDVAEIFCHGSSVIVDAIVRGFIGCGARLAENGEFTRRAFENGKLSLTEAEGVADLIDARCESAARAAYNLAGGALSKKIAALKESIVEIAAEINVSLDYPEEDLSADISDNILSRCEQAERKISALAATFDAGRKASSGIRVVIAGRPNAGKSTLLNALVGYERAIVTDEEGTTRDTVDDEYIYGGARFIVTDTAGVRKNAKSKAEQLGIERSIEAVKGADCVLLLDDELESVAGNRGLRVHTKADIDAVAGKINVSGKTKEGIDDLKQAIYDMTKENVDEVMLTNLRQYGQVRECADCLHRAVEALKQGEPDEICSMELFAAIAALGAVDGAQATEQVVNKIFSRFCVGK